MTEVRSKGGIIDRSEEVERYARASQGKYATSQEEIDSILANELSAVKFTVHPTYNPRIRGSGLTRVIKDPVMGRSVDAILIGKQERKGKRFLIDSLLHEELEARIALREGIMDKASDDVRHDYIQRIIDRFMKVKEL